MITKNDLVRDYGQADKPNFEKILVKVDFTKRKTEFGTRKICFR